MLTFMYAKSLVEFLGGTIAISMCKQTELSTGDKVSNINFRTIEAHCVLIILRTLLLQKLL